jgi:hypothetical protein
MLDLAALLPPLDDRTGALRIHRADGSVDLLDAGCGDDEMDGMQPAGHAQLAADEAIADALRLPPGASAAIELIATLPLTRNGTQYRIALPETRAACRAPLTIQRNPQTIRRRARPRSFSAPPSR